ncbi:hypothetical protein Bca4012_004694 [Brassica carinata]
MQDDEVIWQAIRHNHCSYMAKIETGIFCRNPYNVTGICNRSSCPLANSRYATIRDHDELLERLMKGVYPKILDYPELVTDVQKEVEVEEEEEEEPEIEYVEGYDELLEEVEEDIEDFYGGFPSKESHLDGDDDYDFEDDDDGEEQVVIHKKGRAVKKFDGNGKSKKKSRVVVEVEQEDDTRQSLKSLKL